MGGHSSKDDRRHIGELSAPPCHDCHSCHTTGPEYGFGFALNTAFNEPILIIKTAWGGKILCGDFRPPSSSNATHPVGFYYKQMLQYVKEVLAPANLTKLFGSDVFAGKTPKIVGLGWNGGCGVQCTSAYEDNMVSQC